LSIKDKKVKLASDEGIINKIKDRRMVVPQQSLSKHPHNCIGLVHAVSDIGNVIIGTAFLISSNLVVTAGHMVYWREITEMIHLKPQYFYLQTANYPSGGYAI